MGTSVNVAGTLRTQEHGHQPIIFSAGFDPEMGAKARGIACEQEKAPTLTAQKIAAVLECEQPAAVQPEPLVMATARTKAEILTGTSPTILSGNERLMRCTFYRGLTRVSNWVRLKICCHEPQKAGELESQKALFPFPPPQLPLSFILQYLCGLSGYSPNRPLFDRLGTA